jgi:hypothetical protein
MKEEMCCAGQHQGRKKERDIYRWKTHIECRDFGGQRLREPIAMETEISKCMKMMSCSHSRQSIYVNINPFFLVGYLTKSSEVEVRGVDA